MDSEKWSTIKRILDEAAVGPAAERRAVVERECGDDPALLSEVESFLAFDEEIEDFIEHPLWSIRTTLAAAREPRARQADSGRRIGAYRLLRLLDRGGMGIVFLAAREDDYDQQVALKLVNWGMDTEEVLRRFYTERQILANLQHPGIARLLDGGTTEDGMPYFVMEYVEGEPIDRYCKTRQLSLSGRLELFKKVCAVVHYAHQNLVVHRDLKPGNILITEDGEPKLLDFGIAKLLEPDRLGEGAATIPGQGPMTPDYASPEQILNAPITTACDVYALGVLLYRLLSGQAPYYLRGRGYVEMVNLVCLNEPRKPSSAYTPPTKPDRSTHEALPQPTSSPGHTRRIQRQLAGDLDAIVMKAMRKEPQHRYASALELAGDIHRHLTGLPVEARQGSWTYVACKFVRRHMLGLAAVLLFLGFAIATTVLWRQAVQERARAEREQARAEGVTKWVIGLFKAATPDESKGEDVRVRELVQLSRERVLMGDDLANEDKAELSGVLGIVLEQLGMYEEAEELREEALRIRRELYPGDHPDLATAMNNLASSYYHQRAYDKAEELFRQALEMWQRLHDDSQLALVMFNLASIVALRGDLAEAEELHGKALKIRKRILDPDDPDMARSFHGLAIVHLMRGDAEKAESLLRQALDIFERNHGPENTNVADVRFSLGKALHAQGDDEAAKVQFEEALSVRLKLLGAGDEIVAKTQTKLASVLLDLGDTETAGTLINSALETLREKLPEGDKAIVAAEAVRKDWLLAAGRDDEPQKELDDSAGEAARSLNRGE